MAPPDYPPVGFFLSLLKGGWDGRGVLGVFPRPTRGVGILGPRGAGGERDQVRGPGSDLHDGDSGDPGGRPVYTGAAGTGYPGDKNPKAVEDHQRRGGG